MRKGERTVTRICPCGCEQQIPPYISKWTGRVEFYPKFVPGHGWKDWGKRLAQRIAENGHPMALPTGSRWTRKDGYVKMKTADGDWRYEHRLVAGEPVGKLVHHRDKNPSNNDPSNLEPMSSAEHQRHHRGLNGRWSKRHRACWGCQTTACKHVAHGLCTRCYQKPCYRG